MQHLVSSWFQDEKRDLPWRQNLSPYAVWVSEVMLQQTQVAVVIPYFTRWMQQFPTVESLAKAPLDAVIKAWEGLGYYSRARHLHAGACYVVEKHGGQLPQDKESLSKIKGLGPYTVGAIRSFAFRQKAAAVDGNVIRVLARYFHLSDDISLPKTTKKLWEIAEELLPDDEPWIFTEAMIELGATICTKKPKCAQCPVKQSCLAYRTGDAEELPYKSAKISSEKLHRAAVVIYSEDGLVLVKRGEKGKIMSDLYEFPYFDTSAAGPDEKEILNRATIDLGLTVEHVEHLPTVQHSFTRFTVRLFPSLLKCPSPLPVPDCEWVAIDRLERLPFSSGHRRLLHAFLNMKHSAISLPRTRENGM